MRCGRWPASLPCAARESRTKQNTCCSSHTLPGWHISCLQLGHGGKSTWLTWALCCAQSGRERERGREAVGEESPFPAFPLNVVFFILSSLQGDFRLPAKNPLIVCLEVHCTLQRILGSILQYWFLIQAMANWALVSHCRSCA